MTASPPFAAVASVAEGDTQDSVVVSCLNFSFPFSAPVIHNLSLELPRGSRCLLTGANGAGKTSLLQVLAGKYMVGEDAVRILGRPAFHDIQLVASGELSYLGPQWRRDIAFAGNNVPMQGDIGAGQMLFGVEGVDPARRDRLIKLLDIDLSWRLNRVSDGQRRRVQICMGLLKPYQVLLLDEITVDMDVVGRLDLLAFFTEECEERGATIIYATHIFDGLERWPTHFAYLEGGRMLKGGPMSGIPELQTDGKLLHVVEGWLRIEKAERRRLAAEPAKPAPKARQVGSMEQAPAGGGRYSHEITKEEIEQYYNMPCEEASKQLGIGLTILKRICRRLGIEKWPYRQLKRAGKLGDPTAAAAAASGGPVADGGEGGDELPSPFSNAGGSGGSASNGHAAGGQQQRMKLEQQRKDARNHSWKASGQAQANSDDSDDSGGSWQAQHRSLEAGLPRIAAPGSNNSLQRQASEPSPPVPPAVAPVPRRRLSSQQQDGGGFDAPAAGGPSGGTAANLQRAQSATLKRIREEEQDVLFGILGPSVPAPDAGNANPFAAAAKAEAPWESPSGGTPRAHASGTDTLAASLNRLAMRTLSLKRQCSRDDTALDALDQALLQERMEAQVPQMPQGAPQQRRAMPMGLNRACSMPSAGSGPPMSPLMHARNRQQASQLQAVQFQAAQLQMRRQMPDAGAGFSGFELPPKPPGQRLQPGGAASSPFAGVVHRGGAGMERIEEPADGDTLLSDPSMTALILGSAVDRKASADGGMLLDPGASGPVLLYPAGSGPRAGQLQRGGAQGDADMDVLTRDASLVFLQQAAAAVADVTRVGSYKSSRGGAAGGPSKDQSDMLTPFGLNVDMNMPDSEVDDLLADFLSPDPFNVPSDAKMAELLTAFSPQPSPKTEDADDPLAAHHSPQAHDPGAAGPAAAAPLSSSPPHSAFATAHAQLPGDSGSMVTHDASPKSSGTQPQAPSGGATQLPADTDVLELASQLVTDPDPIKQLLATRLLQMQQAHQQQLQSQQVKQAQQLMAHHAAQHQMMLRAQAAQQAAVQTGHMLPGQPWPAAAAGHAAGQPHSPVVAELQQIVQQQRALQQAYLLKREEVKAMLERRGGAPPGIAGDAERLEQLAHLKQLKEQLAAAQARQLELIQQREARMHAHAAAQHEQVMSAPLPPAPDQQHQPYQQYSQQHQQAPHNPQAGAGGGVSAFAADASQLAPLPLTSPASQQQQQQQPEGGVAELFSQWRGEADSLELSHSGFGRWSAQQAQLVPDWGTAHVEERPPQQQQQQQLRQQRQIAAQRAASAPVPFDDLDWSALL
ncbi:ABC transporter I family member 19 [Chlorella vulgaris]